MLPLMKERRDRESGANLFVSGTSERQVFKELESNFTMNTWTVPLSLETTNHLPLGENEMLRTTALSEPLLSCITMSELSSMRYQCQVTVTLLDFTPHKQYVTLFSLNSK